MSPVTARRPGRPALPSLTTAMPTEGARALLQRRWGLPQQVRHWAAGSPAAGGLPRTDVFFRSEISEADSACVGFAAAWQHCGSSAEQSRPAARHPKATAPLTACVTELAWHNGAGLPACLAQHTRLCAGKSQAEHGAQLTTRAAPRQRRGTGCTDSTPGEDRRRKRGRAAGMKPGRNQHRASESGERPSRCGAAQEPSEQGGQGCSERRDKHPAREEP